MDQGAGQVIIVTSGAVPGGAVGRLTGPARGQSVVQVIGSARRQTRQRKCSCRGRRNGAAVGSRADDYLSELTAAVWRRDSLALGHFRRTPADTSAAG